MDLLCQGQISAYLDGKHYGMITFKSGKTAEVLFPSQKSYCMTEDVYSGQTTLKKNIYILSVLKQNPGLLWLQAADYPK